MKTINIRSNNASTSDGIAYAINAETGVVVQITALVDDINDLPCLFDVAEYKNHYGHLNDTIDILDIGYTTHDGHEEKPEADYRLRIMKQWYEEAMRLLDTVVDQAEDVLKYHGQHMREVDRKKLDDACHGIREFQHRVNYTSAEG